MVKFIKVAPNVKVPEKQTPGSAGYDLHAASFKTLYYSQTGSEYTAIDFGDRVVLNPGDRLLVGTGLSVAIPEGYELQIRSRSGLALKEGLVVANSPGCVDPDFRGEVGVILLNTSKVPRIVNIGDRIAQAVIVKYETLEWVQVDELDSTARTGGFGSTGK